MREKIRDRFCEGEEVRNRKAKRKGIMEKEITCMAMHAMLLISRSDMLIKEYISLFCISYVFFLHTEFYFQDELSFL